MPFRKNVFIVGAGFSAEAGMPVVENFFSQLSELGQDPSSSLAEAERKVFQQVLEYRNSMFEAEDKVQVDLDNIEELFGLAEMGAQLGDFPAAETRKNLVYTILRTLELAPPPKGLPNCVYTWQQGPSQRQGEFQNGDIFDFFVAVVARKWFPRTHRGVSRDSIISLNYDLLLERSMERLGVAPSYDLSNLAANQESKKPVDSVRLLKLHGSANWVHCSACRKDVFVLPATSSVADPNVPASLCRSCGSSLSDRLIVPPTWNKEEYGRVLLPVWVSAIHELESAERIFILGYSMPEADKFFRYIMAIGLSNNRKLQEVVVVNRNPDHRERIGKLFKRLDERKRVLRQQDTVRDWIQRGTFQRQTRQVFPVDSFAW